MTTPKQTSKYDKIQHEIDLLRKQEKRLKRVATGSAITGAVATLTVVGFIFGIPILIYGYVKNKQRHKILDEIRQLEREQRML